MKLFSMQGRANRLEYFLHNLLGILILFLGVSLAYFVPTRISEALPAIKDTMSIISTILLLVTIIVYIASEVCVTVRRLCDLGRPKSDFFLLLVPVYNIYLSLVLVFNKGVEQEEIEQDLQVQNPPRKGIFQWIINFFLIYVGTSLIFVGYTEFKVSQGSTLEPLEIELALLEQGEAIDNNHLKIAEHWALFPYSIYEYQTFKGETDDPKPTAKVNYTYYPIISNEHPYLAKLDELEKEYGGLDKVPDKKWPAIGDLAVLVKSKEFATIADIPNEWQLKSDSQGLVINRVESLDEEESRLIQSNFPTVDLNKVLLLEAKRKPISSLKSTKGISYGVLLVLIGLAFLVTRSQLWSGIGGLYL